MRRIQHKFKQSFIAFITLLIIIIITLINPNFISISNVLDVVNNNILLCLAALGMMVVVIAGYLDFSIGALITMVAYIISKIILITNDAMPIFFIFLLACFFGIVFGSINGYLVVTLDIPPIVITIATMSILRGSVSYFSNNDALTNISRRLFQLKSIRLFGFLSVQMIIFIVVTVFFVYILNYSKTGRGIYALGGNMKIAENVGYNIKKLQVIIYSLNGLIGGICAFIHILIMNQIDPIDYAGFELQVIAVVIIGGANFLGGSGTIRGTYLGALFLIVLNNGLIFAHINVFWQQIVVGITIVIVISFDVLQYKKREKLLLLENDE